MCITEIWNQIGVINCQYSFISEIFTEVTCIQWSPHTCTAQWIFPNYLSLQPAPRKRNRSLLLRGPSSVSPVITLYPKGTCLSTLSLARGNTDSKQSDESGPREAGEPKGGLPRKGLLWASTWRTWLLCALFSFSKCMSFKPCGLPNPSRSSSLK
jgi:hypothetical protein